MLKITTEHSLINVLKANRIRWFNCW